MTKTEPSFDEYLHMMAEGPATREDAEKLGHFAATTIARAVESGYFNRLFPIELWREAIQKDIRVHARKLFPKNLAGLRVHCHNPSHSGISTFLHVEVLSPGVADPQRFYCDLFGNGVWV